MSVIATPANALQKWNSNGFIFFSASLLCLLSMYSCWFQLLTAPSSESYFRTCNQSVTWCIEWHFQLPKACSKSKTEQEEGKKESIPTRLKCYLYLPNKWHLAATSRHFCSFSYDVTFIFFSWKECHFFRILFNLCMFNTLQVCANCKPQANTYSIANTCIHISWNHRIILVENLLGSPAQILFSKHA